MTAASPIKQHGPAKTIPGRLPRNDTRPVKIKERYEKDITHQKDLVADLP
jgi:hypothetical protein